MFKRPPLLLAIALAAAVPATASAEQPIEALMAAMELDMGSVVTSSIDTQGSAATMYDVRSSLGVISPYNAPTFAVLSTGNVNNIEALEDYDYPGSGPDTSAGDRAAFSFDIEVPATANSFSFNFYFLSREYPEWVGSAYNDTFEVHLDSNAYQGQIVFDAFGNPVTVNNALFSVVNPAQLTGTGFDADGGTGWVVTIAPCEAGETMHIEFEIYDVADGVWDSAVLIDNFQFSEEEPPEDGPWTGDDTPDVPIDVAFLSPKEGDLEGGYTVTIHGSGFDNTTTVEVGGTPAADVPVGTGGETLIVEDWPEGTAEGSVDITVRKGLEEVVLSDGFTYWDESGGSVPPRVTAVMPSEANPGGGTELRINGVGLDADATVVFRMTDEDGNVETFEATGVEELEVGQLVATSPEARGGWADLVVINNDGLETDPPYPFLFTEDAQQPINNGGTGGTRGCTNVAGSSASGLLALLALVGLAGMLRREWR